MTRKDAVVITLLIGLGLWILGFQVSDVGLMHENEILYAESVRAMLDRGDWLTPYYRGAPRLNKPILFYWLILLSYALGGVSLYVARLCSVSFGVVGIVMTYLAGSALFDRKSGLVAALILLTSWGYLIHARYAMPDMVLTALIALSMYCFIQLLHGSEPSQAERSPGWLIAFYLVLGLATLTKGLPALLPIPIAVAFLLWTRQPSKLRWLISPVGWGVYFSIVLPWFVYTWVQHQDILFNSAYREVVARGLGQLGDAEPLWYFVPLVLGYFFPWSILFAAVIGPYRWWQVGTSKEPHAGRLLLCWFGVILIVLSLFRGKNPQYILPIAIPLALLVGHTWVHFLASHAEGLPRGVRWSLYGIAGLNALVAICLALFISRFFESLGTSFLYVYVAIMAMGALVLLWAVRRRQYKVLFATLGLPIVLIWLVFLGHTLPRYDVAPGVKFARVLHSLSTDRDRVGSMKIEEKTLLFLLQRPIVRLRGLAQARAFLQMSGRTFVVMRETERQRLVSQSGQPLYTITALQRFRQLQLPDIMTVWRNRDPLMETLVLVSNENPG
jgi:4-amino-4-deoxy-L-arabinose transferase-like glycosyltransferase